MELPSDLLPLPTAPYTERPLSLPLDVEECRTAIWRTRGNITEAAELIKVPPSRLRAFVQKSAYLSAELREANEQLVDIAQDIVYDALTDEEDKSRKDTMARFVLTNQGKGRGWGAGASMSIKNSQGGTIIVQWADGTPLGDSESGESKVQAPTESAGSGPALSPQEGPDRANAVDIEWDGEAA